MKEIFIFIIFLLIPFVYYRSLYYIYRDYFKISGLRKKSGLQIHHIHYGVFFILVVSFILLFSGKNNYAIAFLGLGLGLSLDEFVPALLMPWNRKLELEAYEKGFIPTLILLISLIFILLLLLF
ncbi:hypothetical protein HY212_02275 [Candidatus Pacearchaeota archaeon]|nr:hypothetical protein [Candidatus Pacearchaeota archaeon]